MILAIEKLRLFQDDAKSAGVVARRLSGLVKILK
jgi:hypothetical protein